MLEFDLIFWLKFPWQGGGGGGEG